MKNIDTFCLFLGSFFGLPKVKRKVKRFVIENEPKGKNKPCFCGSGKKYKLCCMKKVLL